MVVSRDVIEIIRILKTGHLLICSFHFHSKNLEQSSSSSHSRSHQKKSPYVQLKVLKVPKLSHGLTVQELKEMTRARLASEVTDETGSMSPTGPNDDEQHNRQRVYSHEAVRTDAARSRIDSSDSFRSAPAAYAPSSFRQRLYSEQSYNNPVVKSRSSSRLNNTGISSFYSQDAGDSGSVNSFASGYGGDSHFGSDASGIYTTATSSSRDLGRSVSFPVGENVEESDQYSPFMASASFETGSRRLAANCLPSPALSNLLEDRPFSPEIGNSFSGEGQRFDFAGFPASPAVHRGAFSDEVFSVATPSTSQSYGFSDSHFTNDNAPAPAPVPVLTGNFDRPGSRGAELPKSVAESVLGSSGGLLSEFFQDDSYKPSPLRAGIRNPWNESNDLGVSKLETDLKNLIFSESNNAAALVDDFPFSSFHSNSSVTSEPNWSPVAGRQPRTSRDKSKIAIPEDFHDDGIDFASSPLAGHIRGDGDPSDSPLAKSVNKRRSASRWKFI